MIARFLTASSVALLTGTALAAPTVQTPAGSTASIQQPRYGGTVVLAKATGFQLLNSLVESDGPTLELLKHVLFMTLVRYDAQLEYQPYLARSWRMIGDTAVVFRLRNDVYWHDGVRTTAYDVEFTYNRARDPATAFPNSEYFGGWGAAEVIDSFTIAFHLRPHADPLMGWTEMAIMPRHLLAAVPAAQLRQAPFNRQPVGNGPFRFVSGRANDRWVFEANLRHPAALGGRPYVDRLVWRVLDGLSHYPEFVAGRLDLTGVSPEQFENLKKTPGVRILSRPTRAFSFIGWNGRHGPFADAEVRRALAMAIDRREVLEVVLGGRGRLATGPVPPSHWAYNNSLQPVPYDPAGARALLARAGFRDLDRDGVLEDAAGKKLRFELKVQAENPASMNGAQVIQRNLADVGVRVAIAPVERATLIADISSSERRFEAVLLALQTDIRLSMRDPFHSAAIGGPFQIASYANPEVDRIIDEAPLIADRKRALPLWHRFQEILVQEQPWTFLYYPADMLVVQDRLEGVQADLRGWLFSATRWWVEDPKPAR